MDTNSSITTKPPSTHKLRQFCLLKAAVRSGAVPVAMIRAESQEHAEKALRNVYPDIGWDVFSVVPYHGTPISDVHGYIINRLGYVDAYIEDTHVDPSEITL